MKFKDFLTKLKADGKITNAEFDKAIESAPDFDFADKAIEAFENSFLTIERAANDKAVRPKIMREALDPVDKELQPLIAFIDTLDKFKASEIDKMTSTYDKIKAVQAAVPALIEKVKKAPETDDETKKKLKTLGDTNQELLGRIEKMNSEFTEKEKFFQSDAEKKISEFKVNTELEKRVSKFKFGKAYSDEKIREEITKGRLDRLKAKYPFQFVDKDGQSDLQPTTKDGKPLFKENSNTAVTTNQLLEEEFKDVIRANNAGDDDEDDNQSRSDNSKNRDTKRFNVDDGAKQFRTGSRTTVS